MLYTHNVSSSSVSGVDFVAKDPSLCCFTPGLTHPTSAQEHKGTHLTMLQLVQPTHIASLVMLPSRSLVPGLKSHLKSKMV